MRAAIYSLVFCFLVMAVSSCKSKKKSLAGDEPVAIEEFIEFFPEANYPLTVADSSLNKKVNDSLLINYSVFTQFVPDSVLQDFFGKQTKPKIYPIARLDGGDDTYLCARAVSGSKRLGLLLAFGKDDKYISSMPLIRHDGKTKFKQAATIDSKYNIYRYTYRQNADGTTSEGKDVYVLNSAAGSFMLIMTDGMDEKVTEIINPIDTLSRKQKYTADYGSGKMNLFSFRDGRKADRLSFFIHFEKNNGDCVGELKGEALMRTATTAEYREPGDPCVLRFTFTNNSVTVKEVEPCGSRRDLRCLFDGVYSRKKDIKPKKKATK